MRPSIQSDTMLTARCIKPTCTNADVISRQYCPPRVYGPKLAPQCRSCSELGTTAETPLATMDAKTAALIPINRVVATGHLIEVSASHGSSLTRPSLVERGTSVRQVSQYSGSSPKLTDGNAAPHFLQFAEAKVP